MYNVKTIYKINDINRQNNKYINVANIQKTL